jgi:WD40-like Beta Propeller Repeat
MLARINHWTIVSVLFFCVSVVLGNTAHAADVKTPKDSECHEMNNVLSSSGHRIQVTQCDNGIYESYHLTITKNGSTIKGVSRFQKPSISSDNRYVAYRSNDLVSVFDTASDRVIYSVKLMAPDTMWYSDFIWSPDSKRLAFTAAYQKGGRSGRLLIVDVSTGQMMKVPAGVFETCGEFCYSTAPFWSPDSRYVGTLEPHWGEEEQGRFVICVADTGRQVDSYPLPNHENGFGEYGWSPDGKSLYLAIRQGRDPSKTTSVKIPLREFFKK